MRTQLMTTKSIYTLALPAEAAFQNNASYPTSITELNDFKKFRSSSKKSVSSSSTCSSNAANVEASPMRRTPRVP